MIANRIKNLLLLMIILVSNHIISQDFQGKAYYFSKTSPDMSGWGNGQITDAQKKQISDRMKGMFEKSYILTFDKISSIYEEEEVLSAPGKGGFNWWSSFTAGPQYKNINDNQFVQDQDFYGRQFLITDSLEKLDWKIGNETKQIGKYCVLRQQLLKLLMSLIGEVCVVSLEKIKLNHKINLKRQNLLQRILKYQRL